VNGEIELVEKANAEMMIARKLLETHDVVGLFVHKTQYYNEEEDKFYLFDFTKDSLIILYLIRIFVKFIKEVYIWYLSLKYYVKEVQQCKNKLKKN
jgi:hypothetical protein